MLFRKSSKIVPIIFPKTLKATNIKGVFGGSLMCDHGDIEFKSYSRVGFSA